MRNYLDKALLFGLLYGATPHKMFEIYDSFTPQEPKMTWKQRKKQARTNAQRRKSTRGRSSGTTNKDHVQSKLMEQGYIKWLGLLHRAR